MDARLWIWNVEDALPGGPHLLHQLKTVDAGAVFQDDHDALLANAITTEAIPANAVALRRKSLIGDWPAAAEGEMFARRSEVAANL